MRLTVLGPGHPFRGGIAATTTALVQALARRGHEVAFLTAARQYPRRLYPGAGDRDPDACPRIAGARAVLEPFAPLTWPAARRELLAGDADAWVLPYWTWAWAPLWRFLLAARGRPPAVAVVHNPADHGAGRVRRLAARAVLGRCEGLFTHARALAEGLERDFGGIPVASCTLPSPKRLQLPGRTEARRRLGLPQDPQLALFLGLIRPYKGVDVLLEAAAQLGPASPWRFLIAGEAWGGLGRELVRRVRALGLGGRVRLDLGWVPETSLPAYLGAADLVVLPYRSGSQSAVAPLALEHGIPVLSTRVGGLPELIEDGVNGRLVSPGDPAALAAALAGLDGENLAALAAGARASAGKLGWDAYAAALEGLLESVKK